VLYKLLIYVTLSIFIEDNWASNNISTLFDKNNPILIESNTSTTDGEAKTTPVNVWRCLIGFDWVNKT